MNLIEISKYYTTDKGSIHSYLSVYEQMFNILRNRKIDLLEVGISSGGSLKMWREYFLKGKIIGLDVDKNAIKRIENLENKINLLEEKNNKKK